jgi:hypothetical protein
MDLPKADPFMKLPLVKIKQKVLCIQRESYGRAAAGNERK